MGAALILSGFQQRLSSGEAPTDAMIRELDLAMSGLPPDAELWLFRGALIQLSSNPTEAFSLDDARRSYERALELSPSSQHVLLELGHFHDAVLNEPQVAIAYFQRALAVGPSAEAEEALRELSEEPGPGPTGAAA